MPIDKSHVYKALVEHLSEKCNRLQTWNEQYVHRINKIKKCLRYQKRDVNVLKSRLDKHKDNWRAVPMMIANPKRKIEQKRGPKPKQKQETQASQPQMRIQEEPNKEAPRTPQLQQTESPNAKQQKFRFQQQGNVNWSPIEQTSISSKMNNDR